MATAPRALRRTVAAGGLVLAALTVPAVAALSGSERVTTVAEGQCLAWFGSRGEGQCIGYSNGSPTSIGSPQVGIGTDGPVISTGPLLPGQSFNRSVSP